MDIREMHWEFKKRYNKLDSNSSKDFTPLEIDSILNNAIHIFVELIWSGNVNKLNKFGFEVTQQRIDMLSSLVVAPPVQPSVTPDNVNTNLNKYEFYLSPSYGKLVHQYKHLIRAYAKILGCTGTTTVKLEQHDDLNNVLEDTFRSPSKKWGRIIGVIQKSTNINVESSLYAYTENSNHVIEEMYIEYIKEPVKVSLGNYININGVTTVATDCDLPEQYHTMIVDIAVQELSRIVEDGNRFQLKQEKIISNL